MAFYIELPKDEYGNIGKPPAVVEGRIVPGRTEDRPLGNPDRQLLICAAPAEIAERWPDWYADGWAEVEGPARVLTRAEYDEIIAGLEAGAR